MTHITIKTTNIPTNHTHKKKHSNKRQANTSDTGIEARTIKSRMMNVDQKDPRKKHDTYMKYRTYTNKIYNEKTTEMIAHEVVMHLHKQLTNKRHKNCYTHKCKFTPKITHDTNTQYCL